jgi:hypothetical protein
MLLLLLLELLLLLGLLLLSLLFFLPPPSSVFPFLPPSVGGVLAAPHAHAWRIFNTGEVDALFASACFKTSLVQAPVTSIPDTAPGCMRQPDQSRETMGRASMLCVYPWLIIRPEETFTYSCLALPLRLLSSAFLG